MGPVQLDKRCFLYRLLVIKINLGGEELDPEYHARARKQQKLNNDSKGDAKGEAVGVGKGKGKKGKGGLGKGNGR